MKKLFQWAGMALIVAFIFYYEIWMGGNIVMRFQAYWLKPIWGITPFESHRVATYSMLFFTSLFAWHFAGKYKQIKNKMYSKKKGFNGKRIVKFIIRSLISPAVAMAMMWVLYKLYNL